MLSVDMLVVPLMQDASGTFRVGGTRVPLETVILAFKDGDTAEEIAQKYPALQLTDIYAVLAWYLSRQNAVEQYLAQQQHLAEETRTLVEARCNPQGIRQRLLARRSQG